MVPSNEYVPIQDGMDKHLQAVTSVNRKSMGTKEAIRSESVWNTPKLNKHRDRGVAPVVLPGSTCLEGVCMGLVDGLWPWGGLTIGLKQTYMWQDLIGLCKKHEVSQGERRTLVRKVVHKRRKL